MFKRSNILPAGLAAGIFVLATLAAGLIPSAASPPPAATFNSNLLLKGSNGAAEPSIRTDALGQSFVTGPTGVGGGCPSFRVTHDGSSSAFIGRPDMGVGGGDCDWAIGPRETAVIGSTNGGDLAFSSLTVPNITVNKSDNGGASFGVPNPAAAQVAGDDRMWMAADPKLNVAGLADVFMTYHDVSVGGIEMSVSVDGGQTYAQNAQVIDAALLPQASALGTNAGNELGNVVARRDAAGKLTLYTIFETPEDATANMSGAPNFNRVYIAIGTVSADTAPPVVSWANHEVFHGAPGSRLNRIFPVVAVDGAGTIYSIWSDGNDISVASSSDGVTWSAPVKVGRPLVGANAVNTEIMPWAQAGADGIVDVVFYGAWGGAGTGANPQDDVHNQWNAFFAQSIDHGATWTISQASDHQIHTGPICIDGLNCNPPFSNRDRTLLDFFQVAVDPTNGAATIAYADDHASPGNSVIYYTRQCTGTSATTRVALVNDCKVPPPPPTPPQGNVCPGPQILDFINDAPNNYPGGMGQNMDNLDVVSSTFRSAPGGTNVDVTLKLENLQAPPTTKNPNFISALWTVYFQYNNAAGTWWFVQATSNTNRVVSFSYGTWNGSFTHRGSITGEFNPGPMGTIVYHLPRANIGGPPDGAHLTNTWADTRGAFLVNGTGLFFTAAGDRAPDSNYGADHIVGTPPCAAGTGGGGGGGTGEGDGNGDVQGEHGGDAQFQSDEDGATDGDQNSEKLQDPGAGETVSSTQIDGVQFDTTLGTMTVYGEGVNQLGVPVAFVIVEKKGSPGFYSIEVSDGYSDGGLLRSGSITL